MTEPEKIIPDFKEKFDTQYDFLYKKGLRLFNRKYICTRVAMPYVFARDVEYKEDLCCIKVFLKFFF